MDAKKFDVTGIGSPLLDLTVEVDDNILEILGLTKGQMHLIEEDKSESIRESLKSYNIVTTPGGSSANTLAGVANLGGQGVLIGKVGNDLYADFYISETEKAGVKTRLKKHDTMTGHAITFITSDSERTFATHLGAAIHLSKDDITKEDIIQSRILHIEGYLLEIPEVREATVFAMKIAKEKNIMISVDLADPGLIGRIHDILNDIVSEYTDIVFVNEEEARAFTGKEEEEALNILYSQCEIAVVKLGERGSIIKSDNTVYNIPAYETNVVNTNGAGDMYAAGLLFGISNNLPIENSGRIGSYASSLVVAQTGARLQGIVNIDNI